MLDLAAIRARLAAQRSRLEAAAAAVRALPPSPERAERLRGLEFALLDGRDPCPSCEGRGWVQGRQRVGCGGAQVYDEADRCSACRGEGHAEDTRVTCAWCGDRYPQHEADAHGAHLICPRCAAMDDDERGEPCAL